MDGENVMVFGEELWGEFMIDLDYEFDAPQYYDLSKEEPVMQATSAEKWFDTAKSDPPSPAFMKLLRDLGIISEDNGANNTSEKYSESNDAIQGTRNGKT